MDLLAQGTGMVRGGGLADYVLENPSIIFVFGFLGEAQRSGNSELVI